MEADMTGKLLIAMPSIGDDRFSRSVILVCAHGPDFAMGIVLNKPMMGLTLPDVLNQLDVPTDIELPTNFVLDGGPVGRDRGFVLHSSDFICDKSTMAVDDRLCLTATREILHVLASDNPPEDAVLALGYSGWGPGQLEFELAENAWLIGTPDDAAVFGCDHQTKWENALDSIGVSKGRLLGRPGSA